MDQLGIAGCIHFFAQQANKSVQRVAADVGVESPNSLDQVFARDYPAAALHQELEQAVFSARESDPTTAAHHFTRSRIQREVGCSQWHGLWNGASTRYRAQP